MLDQPVLLRQVAVDAAQRVLVLLVCQVCPLARHCWSAAILRLQALSSRPVCDLPLTGRKPWTRPRAGPAAATAMRLWTSWPAQSPSQGPAALHQEH